MPARKGDPLAKELAALREEIKRLREEIEDRPSLAPLMPYPVPYAVPYPVYPPVPVAPLCPYEPYRITWANGLGQSGYANDLRYSDCVRLS